MDGHNYKLIKNGTKPLPLELEESSLFDKFIEYKILEFTLKIRGRVVENFYLTESPVVKLDLRL